MADDIEIYSALAEGTTRAALEAFGGPAIEWSEHWRDRVRARRFAQQVAIAKEALQMLGEAGLSPKVVDWKKLVPLLDLGSLEDGADTHMRSRWAALLANASADPDSVLPSFPHILGELSSQEAAILGTMYRVFDERWPNNYLLLVGREQVATLRSGLGLDHDSQFYTRFFNLDRLNLCDVSWENVRLDPDLSAKEERIETRPDNVRSTPLGVSFMLACTPPRASA